MSKVGITYRRLTAWGQRAGDQDARCARYVCQLADLVCTPCLGRDTHTMPVALLEYLCIGTAVT